MLRILRDNVAAHQVVLILQGHIVLEWVDVLERECLELSRSGHRVALDLCGVDFIGRSGLELLARLSRGGVGIIGCSSLVADMLGHEGIQVGWKIGDTTEGTVPGTKS